MKTGALILALSPPGETHRDNEEFPLFLPMCPLDGTTVIKREISTLRQAGISPILALTDGPEDVLKNHLSHNHILFVESEMPPSRKASLRTGLQAARRKMDRAVIVPVECPAFSLETLQALLACETSAVPTYRKKRGWPRLLDFSQYSGEIPEDFSWDALPMEEISTEDPSVLLSVLEENGIQKIQEHFKSQRRANELRCKTKVILTKEEDFFGPGVCRLLEYIDETGSIQAAASRMHMSYSKSWKMVNKVEKEMGFPFLNRTNGGKSGGSSTLTEEGRQFIERYRAMVRDMEQMSRNFFDTYFRDFQ